MSDFDLKWDAQNQELYGEDPDTGNKVPVPMDSLSTNTLEATDSITANGTEYLGNFATEADLPDPANVPVGAEATVESDPNGQTSVYKLVDE